MAGTPGRRWASRRRPPERVSIAISENSCYPRPGAVGPAVVAWVRMAETLFTNAAEERFDAFAPLAARMRPRTLDDVVGQAHLVGPDGPLRTLIQSDRLGSVILWGPAGTGKTSLAMI